MRLILAMLLALIPVASQAQQLPTPSYRKLTITGPGSTGDVSGMSVTMPNGTKVTLPDAFGSRLTTRFNDLTTSGYSGLPSYIPFGNTDAKTILYSYRSENQASLLGTLGIVRNTPGSGTFGPGAADYAAFLSVKKDNWDTATGAAAREGELDTIYSLVRQGKKGDATPLLIDGYKRRDNLTTLAADENGGLLGFEIGSYLTNAAGNVYHEVHSYGGFLESPGGISTGKGYGFHTTSFNGKQFAAYGAQVQPGKAGAAGFERFGFLDTTGAADGSGIIWQVDSLGRAYAGLPNSRVTYGYQPGIDTFTFTDESNAVLAAIGRTSKVVTAVGGVQIGTGTIMNYRNATSAVATIPASMAANAVAPLTTLTVVGAKPGDFATCEIISADIGFAGFRVSCAVTGTNQVAVRVQNLTGGIAGGSQVSVTAKVERFQ